jgi:hypothetical protein
LLSSVDPSKHSSLLLKSTVPTVPGILVSVRISIILDVSVISDVPVSVGVLLPPDVSIPPDVSFPSPPDLPFLLDVPLDSSVLFTVGVSVGGVTVIAGILLESVGRVTVIAGVLELELETNSVFSVAEEVLFLVLSSSLEVLLVLGLSSQSGLGNGGT